LHEIVAPALQPGRAGPAQRAREVALEAPVFVIVEVQGWLQEVDARAPEV